MALAISPEIRRIILEVIECGFGYNGHIDKLVVIPKEHDRGLVTATVSCYSPCNCLALLRHPQEDRMVGVQYEIPVRLLRAYGTPIPDPCFVPFFHGLTVRYLEQWLKTEQGGRRGDDALEMYKEAEELIAEITEPLPSKVRDHLLEFFLIPEGNA